MLTSDTQINKAYQYCMTLAQTHYENFPVASLLLTKNIRYPVSAVYAFARSADDFADEGDLSQAERLQLLTVFEQELNRIQENLSAFGPQTQSSNPIFIALEDVIKRFNVPIRLFYDLLQAFKQDISKTRYLNFAEILDYCRLSANPVGRILLYLNNSADEHNLNYSDAICSGLQLINFYQDIAQDLDENDRLYLPLDEMQVMNVKVSDLKQKINNQHTRELLAFQLQRARSLYCQGQPLCKRLSGRFAAEIGVIYHGGLQILHKLEHNTHNIYLRPRLTPYDKIKILWLGVFGPFFS